MRTLLLRVRPNAHNFFLLFRVERSTEFRPDYPTDLQTHSQSEKNSIRIVSYARGVQLIKTEIGISIVLADSTSKSLTFSNRVTRESKRKPQFTIRNFGSFLSMNVTKTLKHRKKADKPASPSVLTIVWIFDVVSSVTRSVFP